VSNTEGIEQHKFPKGQSGNPNGRPKGRRNRATVVRQWLEVSQSVKNPITGETEVLEQQDLIVLAQIKAARDGSTQAFNALMDSADGKVAQRVEVTTPDIKSLPEWMR
jgi:hypothetical protein